MSEQVTFDHYEVLTRGDGSLFELGRGAMGITYKAFDTNLRIPVALKVINVPDLTSEVARGRFVQEARAAAKLRHRHVASVFHLGEQAGTYFYAMEFIDGETVEALVKRRGALPELVALRICLQVARALAAADQHGLVHRDIKPSNLMLVHEDDELCAKVIDFGLAKSRLSEEEGSSAYTTTAGFLGTPHFASPEQLEEKEVDHRSDLYSLGATLWFMLSGRPPFTGALARVVSQHLSAEPPYEQLGGCSPETVAILRKMLAKDAGERFQKALELRQAIEQTSEQLAGGPVAAAARLALEEARVTRPPVADRDAGEYPTGAVVAERYEVLQTLGATNHGWLYHARDVVAQRDVRLMLVALDPQEDRSAFTQLERDMETLIRLEHPGLLRVFGLETFQRRVLVVLQWTNGITLLQLLRSRRKLGPGEVMRLLEKMAAGVDHGVAHGLARLDLGLHQIHVQFLTEQPQLEEQLRQPVEQWPPFELKLNPLAITREISQSLTWAGGQTLVGTASGLAAAAPVDPAVAHTRSLAVLVYELLGGSVSPLLAANAGVQGIVRYSPLANLTEQGNEVLRSALAPDGPYRSAGDFHRALSSVDELEDRHYEKPESTKWPEPSATNVPQESTAPVVVRPREPLPPLPSKRTGRTVALAALLLLVLGGAAYLGLRPSPPLVAISMPTATPEPELPPATPEPVITPPPATPPPPPDRRELLKAALAAAERTEQEGDLPKTVAAWMDVARDFPEAGIGRLHLETVFDGLRGRLGQLAPAELASLEPPLRAAAGLEVISAMLMLGEMLREKVPEEAFRWYSAAAAKGIPAAATQVGLMLSNGLGVPRDLAKAVESFQTAAAKGDAAAMAALGECLLYGKGVEKDVPRAIELLQQAAGRSNVRALNRLGNCYHQGLGLKQDYAEALRLFTKAAGLGSSEALGNLGVLYLNGDGVAKNTAKAVEYIQRGSEAGDGFCMYLFARCFESGTGVTANPVTTQQWYAKAARAGSVRAMEWCKKNAVEF